MNFRESRGAMWGIWGLVAAFGVIQAAIWAANGGVPRRPAVLIQVAAAWIVMLTLAAFSTFRLGGLARSLVQREEAHQATLEEVEQLQTQNAMLDIIARSVDVPLAFQALAQRIARMVPCDRVGLALLGENGEELQTFTARTGPDERRVRPRPEIVFKTDSTAIGAVVRSREPLLINNTREDAGDFIDVNVINTAGFESALLIPLVSKGRSVGTLNVVARQPNAFTQQHVDALLPIAELFGIAYVAQQLQMSLGKYQTMEAMSELTLSAATDINGALQTIIGHCDLIERTYPDEMLQRDLATVVRQAQRIDGLLQGMRIAAQERLNEVAASGMIPSSPEVYTDKETT